MVNSFLKKISNLFSKIPVIIYMIIIVIIGSSFFTRQFFSGDNFLKIAGQTSVLLIVATSMTLIIMIGEIDLSPGGIISLTTVSIALIQQAGISWVASIFIGIFIGIFTGFINGTLVAVGIPSFITTLGMMYMTKGVALGISGGATVAGLNPNFVNTFSGYIGRIPISIIIALFFCFIISYFLNFTTLRSHLYAIGANKEIAAKAGIKVQFNRILVFTISGVFASIAGIIFAARLNCGHPTGGIGFEFEAIASVVIGGNPLIGGAGSLINTIFGVSLIGILKNSLNMFGFPVWWQMGIDGGVLIVAMIIGNAINLVTYKKIKLKN